MSDEWSYERKFQQFMTEIHERFIKERDFWHKVYEHEIEIARAKDPDFGNACERHGISLDFFPENDCLEWDLYVNTNIEHDRGMIKIILGSCYVLRPEWCYFFEHSSVAWSTLFLKAEIIDNEPRVVLQIMMIDYWDDDKEAEWHKNHKWEPDHKYDISFFGINGGK